MHPERDWGEFNGLRSRNSDVDVASSGGNDIIQAEEVQAKHGTDPGLQWTKFDRGARSPVSITLDNHPPPQHHALSILCLNCGRGGLSKAAKEIFDVTSWLRCQHSITVDVLVLNEIHLRPGEVGVLPGYRIVWEPRPSCPPEHAAGGVGFAIRADLELAGDPTLIHRSSCGDFSMLQIQTGSGCSAHTVLIGSMYAPPNGKALCRSDCVNARCLKSHLVPLLRDVAKTVITSANEREPSIYLGGDLNVRFGMKGSREHTIKQELLDVCSSLFNVNPRDERGNLQPTRQDPSTGVETILDTAYWSYAKSNVGSVYSTLIRNMGQDCGLLLDHFPILTLVPARVGIQKVHSGHADRIKRGEEPVPRMSRVKQSGPPVPRCLIPRSVVAERLLSDDNDRANMCTRVASALERYLMKIAGQPLSTVAVRDGLLAVDSTILQLVREKRQQGSQRPATGIGMNSGNQAPGLVTAAPTSVSRPTKSAHSRLCKLLKCLMALKRNGHQPSAELLQRIDECRAERKHERIQARKVARAWHYAAMSRLFSSVQACLSHGNRHSPDQSRRQFYRMLTLQARGNPVSHKAKRRPACQASLDKLQRLFESCAKKYSAKSPTDPIQAEAVKTANAKRDQLRSQMESAAATTTVDKLIVTELELDQAIRKLSASSAVIGPVTPALLKQMNTLEFRKALLPWIQSVFDTGSLPERLCVIKAFLIHKTGDPNEFANYRVIGVGDVWSRLVQTIIWSRLESWFRERNIISDCQFGFVRGRSAEMAAATAMMTSETLRATGHCIWKIFIDVKGAFPSVNHSILLGMLAENGVAPALWRVLDSWLTQLQMFVQVDGVRSALFPVDIGVPEGGVPSGGLYDMYEEYHIRAIRQAAVELAGPCRCVWRQLHVVVTIIVYADDIVIIVCWYEAAQYFMEVLVRVNFRLLLTLNFGENKTAAQLELPYECSSEQAVAFTSRKLHAGGVQIPETKHYKHVGVWQSAEGREQSADLRTSKLEPVLNSIVAKSIRCHSKALSIGSCALLLRQYWLPQVTFAMGLTYSKIPDVMEKKINGVMRTLAGTSFLPLVVLRSLFGLPTWRTMLNLDKLRLLFKLLGDNGMACRVLEAQVACWLSKTGASVTKNMWWTSVYSVLGALDSVNVPVCVSPVFQVTWTDGVMAIIQHGSNKGPIETAAGMISRDVLLEAMITQYKKVCMLDECARQKTEIGRLSSLSEVRDLVAGLNAPPFTLEPRSNANTWRILCRGGVRVAFGHQTMHFPKCPWCGLAACFTIPHLVRDCHAWSTARDLVYREALSFGQEAGVMSAHNMGDTVNQQNWYLLTMGATVPNSFCNIGLEVDTHLARNKQNRAMASLRKDSAPTYLKLLRVTGVFLSRVMCDTAKLMKCEIPNTPTRWTAQQKRRLVPSQKPRAHRRKAKAGVETSSEEEWDFCTDTEDSEADTSCSEERDESPENQNESESESELSDVVDE
jgi:hypothetical protein